MSAGEPQQLPSKEELQNEINRQTLNIKHLSLKNTEIKADIALMEDSVKELGELEQNLEKAKIAVKENDMAINEFNIQALRNHQVNLINTLKLITQPKSKFIRTPPPGGFNPKKIVPPQ